MAIGAIGMQLLSEIAHKKVRKKIGCNHDNSNVQRKEENVVKRINNAKSVQKLRFSLHVLCNHWKIVGTFKRP